MSMRTKVWLSLGTALLAMSGVASAGYKGNSEAEVTSTYANGSLGAIRNSPDTQQFADVIVHDNTWAWFFMVDANGKQGSCTTTDANFIALARSVNGGSYIHFEWNKLGQCTFVSLRNGSYHAPPVL